jgi:alpha-L-fucosidase 2
MKPLVALAVIALLLAPAFTRAGEIRRDVEYGRAPDGTPLRLDVHVPDGSGRHLVAILVHGGGWTAGDKAGSDKPGNGADMTPWFAPLTAANVAWFSINYRLAPKYRWPACFDDVRTAIRWVKAHAAEFGGDPHRIALIGHSAGGQLVCLAGTLADETTRVQAVVGFAAVTDLEADTAHRHGLSSSLQQLFGTAQLEPTPEVRVLLHDASPISHVRPGLPPFLLLHGDADKTVPYQQSLTFQARLRANGDRCDLITIPGAAHGLLAWSHFAPDYATQMVGWLRQTLDEPAKLGHR